MIFLTEKKDFSGKWTENIEADSWKKAELICPEDEIVIGQLIEIIYAPEID